MSRDSETTDIRKRRAGDIFLYAMSSEYPVLFKKTGFWNSTEDERPIDEKEVSYSTGISFFAFLAYMWLRGYITRTTMNKIRVLFLISSCSDEHTEDMKKISKCIMKELKRNFDFTDTKSLVEKLNSIVIEEWAFHLGAEIFDDYIYSMCATDTELFFVTDDKDNFAFYKLDMAMVKNSKDLRHSYARVELGQGFACIEDYDRDNSLIYLKSVKQSDFYYTYDIANSTFTVRRGQFFSLRNGNCFVIRDGKKLVKVKEGEPDVVVDEYKEESEYSERDGYYLVEPTKDVENFFRPYRLTYDGEILEAESDECVNAIYPVIFENIFRNSHMYRYFALVEKRTISLRVIQELETREFGDGMVPGTVLKRAMFKDMVKRLEETVKTDDELTDLFYEFLKTEYRLYHEEASFPSSGTYSIIISWFDKLHREKSIISGDDNDRTLIKGDDGEFITIADSYKKHDEKYQMMEEISSEPGESESKKTSTGNYGIGYFDFDSNGDFAGVYIRVGDGLVVGNTVIPKGGMRDWGGMVVYDSSDGRFYAITIGKSLTSEQRRNVLEFFYLDDSVTTFQRQCFSNN